MAQNNLTWHQGRFRPIDAPFPVPAAGSAGSVPAEKAPLLAAVGSCECETIHFEASSEL